jgi:hypothetical protein
MTLNSYTNLLSLAQVLDNQVLYETRLINNDTGQALYIGLCATPSGSTSELIWYVRKLTYDDNGFLNYVQLPNSGVGFIYSWDLVTTYF